MHKPSDNRPHGGEKDRDCKIREGEKDADKASRHGTGIR
jgi:hypothetical protein